MRTSRITVPIASFQAPTHDDNQLKERLKEIRRRLLAGEPVEVDRKGALNAPGAAAREGQQPALVVPPGKLAASLYWYENDADLFHGEMAAMSHFFPDFKLQREGDGRLSWFGTVRPGTLEGGSPRYSLLAVYSHNHPSNDSYGGSVKVYVVEPDLEELTRGTGIPHTLRDSAGQLYLCTARKEDIRTGPVNTSAASSIGMAVKWLAAFEAWVAGAITTDQFAGHKI